MQIAQDCHDLKNIQDFREFIRTKIRNLFPHDMAICGIGDLKSRRVTRLINIDFPNRFIRYAVQPNQVIHSPISHAWLNRRQPVIYCCGQPGIEVDQQFLSITKSCNINSIAAHGVVDPYSQCFSYFSFANVGISSEEGIQASLITFIPYLHYALTRILTLQNAAANVFDCASTVFPEEVDTAKKPDAIMSLTPRENEILTWIAGGKCNGDIAQILGISPYTVNNHIKSLFKRLDVSSRAQAVSKASVFYKINTHNEVEYR